MHPGNHPAIRASRTTHAAAPRAFVLVLSLLTSLLTSGCSKAAPPELPAPRPGTADAATDALFRGPVPSFDIDLKPPELESLRREPRKSVTATLRSGSNVWPAVAIRIKGAAGSTRHIDDLPALTINTDRFEPNQRVHGLKKFHLNNSVQDASRMCEITCADLYRRAGIPAARATHAVVRLNGRLLGLYVLKEGFDKTFLNRNFTDPSGNLYDGGFLRDVDQQLELDSGKEPPDWKDLQALATAANLPDPGVRKARLARLLDLDRFITYTALQVLTEDWDGYPCNRNNYRLYFEPASGRFTFLPHGMDQMFGQGGMPLNRSFEGIVAAQVFSTPEWKSAYFDRISTLLTNVFTTNAILANFDEAVARREPALSSISRGEAEAIRSSTRALRRAILHRISDVQSQIAQRPKPLRIEKDGQVQFPAWTSRLQDAADAAADRLPAQPGTGELLRLSLSKPGILSWRTRFELDAGRYRITGRARTENLTTTPNDRGTGLGLRLSGSVRTNRPQNELQGTTDWTSVSFDFALDQHAEVELVAEMRGLRGTGYFDTGGFRIQRLP